MESLNRREFLAVTAAVPPLMQARNAAQAPAPSGLFVSIHQASTSRYDFKTSVEGIAKAGVRAVEVDLQKVRDFVGTQSPNVAKTLLSDLGLRAVSGSNHLGLPDASDAQLADSLEQLKWKVELAQAIGCDRIVCPSTSTGNRSLDDYKRGVANLVAGAEIAKPFNVTLMLEFAKTSSLAGSLPSALKLVREAKHSNVRVMIDTFHFWSGISKFEDLELLQDGELAHLHFEDVPADPPREMQGQAHRAFPGEGIAPLRRIVEVLKRKKYTGPASLELFQAADARIQGMDPFQLASKAKAAIEPLIA